jgi:hypothetical protein
MHFLPEQLDNYIVSHSEAEPKLLQQLTRETYQKVLQPIMLSGPYQGRVLSMISKIVRPKTISRTRHIYWLFHTVFGRRASEGRYNRYYRHK